MSRSLLNALVFVLLGLIFGESQGSIHKHYDHFQRNNKYVEGIGDAMEYFTEFGYIDPTTIRNDNQSMSMEDVRDVIMDFQQGCSLKQTGRLDEPTMAMINTPRCGNKDVVVHNHRHGHQHPMRPERYVLFGSKWETAVLTYKITQYSQQRISRALIDTQVRRAFQIWENEINLMFIESTAAQVDIEVKFQTRAHGDNFPFEGTYTLAHAFYPGTGLGGDVHFNDEVEWASDPTALLYTAVHEIGHSLGLRHSTTQGAVMFPHYMFSGTEVSLHSDDVAGAQELYGSKDQRTRTDERTTKVPTFVNRYPFRPESPTSPPTTTVATVRAEPPFRRRPPTPSWPSRFPTAVTTRPPSSSTLRTVETRNEAEAIFWERRNSELCQNGIVDAVVDLHNGTVLVFRRDFILPLHIIDGKLVAGRIQSIQDVFKGQLPSDIDAGFTRDRGDKTYYFKGNEYWRASDTKIEDGYPKLIGEHFPGIPNKVDAAFEWSNHQMYFFKGEEYWRFDPRTRPSVSENNPSKISEKNWEGAPTYDVDAVFRLVGDGIDKRRSGGPGHTYFFRRGRYWRFDDQAGKVPTNVQPPYPRDARIWLFGCTDEIKFMDIGQPVHSAASKMATIGFFLAILIGILALISGTVAYEVHDMSDAMQYLSRFGYVGKDTATSMNIVDAGDVIREFQRMAGVNQTGELDSETMHMMNVPRCGNKDMDHEMVPDEDEQDSSNTIVKRRWKRFRLNEYQAKWRKPELTYRMAEYSPRTKVPPELIERDVAHAFRIWEGATNLNFVKSNARDVDIELNFAAMRHHDDFPFDGPGRTLAHAFPPGPGLGGDVHFDDSETWSVDSPKGTNVLFVAVHEIGHALGLSHSDAKGAIMQAFYGGYRPQLKLHDDDIAGIQALYGKREIPTTTPYPRTPRPHNRLIPLIGRWNNRIYPNLPSRQSQVMNDDPHGPPARAPPPPPTIKTTTTTTTTTTKPPKTTAPAPTKPPTTPGFTRPDLCKDPKFDAITTAKDGSIYVFKGSYAFRIDGLNGGLITQGWPNRIEFKFRGLEGNIDAALTRSNGKTYFFKGGKYWRSQNTGIDGGYPKSVSKHFPGIPDYVDSAFENPETGQMYFTKGDKLWRFDPKAASGQHVEDIYPISITTWGLPESGIDAAFVAPTGAVYFFKDDNYWKFDTHNFKVADAQPPYPRSVRSNWFHCDSKPGTSGGVRNLRHQDNDMYFSYNYPVEYESYGQEDLD